MCEELAEAYASFARPSYPVAPAAPGTYPDQQQVATAIETSGIEAVLVIVVSWARREGATPLGFVQPRVASVGGGKGWDAFYTWAFAEPPTIPVSNTIVLDGSLYDVRRETLLWSARTAIDADLSSQSEWYPWSHGGTGQRFAGKTAAAGQHQVSASVLFYDV
jgi:hypothetical protein